MSNNSYTAADMSVLEGLDAVRKRPGMYIGSTDSRGLNHLIWEIVDNSVDEALAGYAKNIDITLHADGSVQVDDDGRGIPTDLNKKVGLTGVEIAYQKLHGGGKFGGTGYKSAGGLHGVGASVVNALSTRLDVTVYRENKKNDISFQRGVAGNWASDNDEGKFTHKIGLNTTPDKRPAAVKKARPTGTSVRWWHDQSIFLKNSVIDLEAVLTRARQTAFLVPSLTITVKDVRNSDVPVDETFHFAGGLVDMVDYIAVGQPLHKTISLQSTGSFVETVPVLDENQHMISTDVEREVEIDVAFAYNSGYDTQLRSFVNIVNTSKGGTHVSGLEAAMSKVIIGNIKATRGLLKPKEDAPNMEDIREGLTMVISVKFPEPQFEGQTKEVLGTNAVRRVVQQAITKKLTDYVEDKKNAAVAKTIYTKVVEASRVRLAARAQKDTARKQTALESSSSMPDKLVACSSKDSSITELQICEGDSALGGLKLSRSSSFQAIYPLKGKPLNVYNANLSKVLENQEWADLIQIIGAGVGKTFDLEQMRYKRIILLADADPDGHHITVLLSSFFWKYMRPMIEDGRLYIAMPPLFSITTTGKTKERFYALNKEELDKLTTRLAAQNKKYTKIQRHKGLGEYSPEILAEVVMKPESRILRQVTAEDVKDIERVLELTMGSSAESRRDWIVENRELIADEELEIA
jgi:DNA gyrase subunit B